MFKRDISLYIVDILIASNKIKRYTKSFTSSTDFLHSELEWDATIRELQLIGDAINILIQEDFLTSAFRRIVDFRNQIVHGILGSTRILYGLLSQVRFLALVKKSFQLV